MCKQHTWITIKLKAIILGNYETSKLLLKKGLVKISKNFTKTKNKQTKKYLFQNLWSMWMHFNNGSIQYFLPLFSFQSLSQNFGFLWLKVNLVHFNVTLLNVESC